jgi:hypothetical protein
MIKRLTDEPLRLNEALEGARFPLKLQHVIDHALERMPNDRYASVEEFTREATQAVSGEFARPTVDTDRVTEVIETGQPDEQPTEQIPKTRISAAKPTIPLEQAGAAETVTPDTPLPLTQASPGDKRRGKKKPAMVVAASIVVVAAGAGAIAVAMSGGNGQLEGSGDSTFPAINLPVAAIDTGESDPGLRAEDTTQTRVPPAGGAATGDSGEQEQGPGPTAPPAIDTAAINTELGLMIDSLDNADRRPSLMVRAQDIFNDVRMPAYLRADAAVNLGYGHWQNDDLPQACGWIDTAMQLMPERRSSLQRIKAQWGCP